MARKFQSLDSIREHGFDALIDVRSPAEFEIDHIPGAINLPSLSNEERAKVGTVYKQESPFMGRKIGASLVLSNVAQHIAGPLQNHDGSWRPLVYCWRGGQRSGVFASLLKEVGWRAEFIEGGYQTYRKLLYNTLYEAPVNHKLVLLDGYTGTAKTAVLQSLKAMGVQIIDLEGLAGHRGSLLGEMPNGQPTQRSFETQLSTILGACDPTKFTVVEAESSKIGKINLPPSLWKQMCAAPRIRVTAPLDARVDFIAREYADILADPKTVECRLEPLRRLRGHAMVDLWAKLQAAGDYTEFARSLIQNHYDPAYATFHKRQSPDIIHDVNAMTLDKTGQQDVAKKIVEILKAL